MSDAVAILLVEPPDGAPPRLATIPLPGIIGRGADADLRLDDPRASARHARLIRSADGGVTLFDERSFNGLFVDGERIAARPIDPTHRVRIGRHHLQLVRIEHGVTVILRCANADGEKTRHVTHLPSAIGLDDRERFAIGATVTHPTSALLADGSALSILHIDADGAVTTATADESGSISWGAMVLSRSQLREQPLSATDLVLDDGGPLPRLSLSRIDSDALRPFFASPVVDVAQLGAPVHEARFAALGGGIGSFCWVDALRIRGIPVRHITVVGFESSPFARYRRLCRNSQIPDHERLRSNSESCPDNVWGVPGYAAREITRDTLRLRWGRALATLWKVTGEPDFSPTYTPRAIDVFRSIEIEARRIGWSKMLSIGRIRGVRKTTDGRFAVAVTSRPDPDAPAMIVVAPIVHLALGYPGLRFLEDLRTYRERTRDFERVVNAYEDHDALYQTLAQRGGTVVLRGRGIVASRILQRLHETRSKNSAVRVVHLMRTRLHRGQRAGFARRRVEHHWEFQPFNWPEACWGGELAQRLERSPPGKRAELIDAWGGTTTADRTDWRRIVESGLRDGWYETVIGRVDRIEADDPDLVVHVTGDGPPIPIRASHIIDATGLVADVRANPVFADLIDTYDLPLNPRGGLDITSDFEIRALRHDGARAYVAGVASLGGPYAPVDSFLGLQYAAEASLAALAPRVPSLDAARSIGQWIKWSFGARP